MGFAVRKQHRQRRRGIRAGEVSAGLAQPGEYGLRDELMELGFKRFACRGLRRIVERDGRRLYLVANSTRFAMLGEAGGHPNLASHALKRICARLSADRERAFGHPPVLAQTFADGSRQGRKRSIGCAVFRGVAGTRARGARRLAQSEDRQARAGVEVDGAPGAA